MNISRAKPFFHLSTFSMEVPDRFDESNRFDNDFDENIQEYIHRIHHCSNRSQAINLRTNALKFIDQWRLQRLEQLDEQARSSGQLILNAFDKYQSKRQYKTCSHRLKQSSTIAKNPTIPVVSKEQNIYSSSSTANDVSNDNNHYLQKTEQQIEVSVNKLKSSSSIRKKISFNSIDFGRDFTFETLAHLSSSTQDNAMIVCENNTLIYSQYLNELVILSLINSKNNALTKLDKKCIIRDLCYVDWLFKCLVITNEQIYLLDYRTTQCDLIESGHGYICGAIDNHRCIFYLVKQSTLYKYDKKSLLNLQADEYPIADGFKSQRISLDHKTNDHLALLVKDNNEKYVILVYSTISLADGYLYKIMIDDQIEREWICSSGNQGWLIRGTYPGSCFDLNINGLGSVRIFDCNEIRNIIPMNEHQRFIIRTKTDIFILNNHSVSNFNK
ncbi:unnamed protein product [Adineta steineri]|uniref:Uncharacterized protein n=1 Tax=Adineta steineri TaxID=433720 RepID=A0A818IRQ3_9BILA|nr:unnamed protein product [Adineta steineri]